MAYTFNTDLTSIAAKYAKISGVRIARATIKEELVENPYFPSLLSLSELFSKYNISNSAFEIDGENLSLLKFEQPFVAYMRVPNVGNDFVLVMDITPNTVSYLYKGSIKKVSKEYFLQKYQNVIWFAEPDDINGQPNFFHVKKQEKIQDYKTKAKIITAIFLLIFAFVINLDVNKLFIYAIITMVKLVGLSTTILLLLYELDKSSAFVKNICSIGKKTNCDAVLNSKGARILGISWSEIGFFYFASTTLGLFSSSINFETKLAWVAVSNAIVLPYIVYSLYYQVKVVKQWCVLCLATQTVLLVEFVLCFIYVWEKPFPDIFYSESLCTFVVCLILPILTWYSLKQIFTKSILYKNYNSAYKRLQNNPDIFNALLHKQQTIPDGWQNLGIDIGNKEAENVIIKICNPYCTPCDQAHPKLEKIINNNKNIRVKIIFLTPDMPTEIHYKITQHILAIADKNDSLLLLNALDDWYMHLRKNYELFSSKYPMNGELAKQASKITLMSRWCDKAQIVYTPTIFYNGFRLPENYELDDLEHVLKKPLVD